VEELSFCDVCGQPGEASWGMTLCEACTGAAGATCAGLRRDPEKPDAPALPETC
jgi:hypothetical protein